MCMQRRSADKSNSAEVHHHKGVGNNIHVCFYKISFFYGFCNISFHFDAEFNNALVIQGWDDNCRMAH